MRKILLLIISLLLFASQGFCQSGSKASGAIMSGVTGVTVAGTTWYYPNSITDFPDTSNNIADGLKVGSTVTPGASVTITKLAVFIGDKQTASECSVGIYTNLTDSSKLAGCHFTPVTGAWGECTVSYAIDSGTTYVLWADCNQDYKMRASSTSCTPYYSNAPPYVQDMPSGNARTADSGCTGQRMGY